jgi:hypothetical protein
LMLDLGHHDVNCPLDHASSSQRRCGYA